MSISYEEALATLQNMFGEPWTRETLDAVLRHEKGHMENTVDLILRHGTGGKDPQTLVDELKAGVDLNANVISADEELARQLAQQEQNREQVRARNAAAAPSAHSSSMGSGAVATAAAPGQKKGAKGTPTVLPDDFLRIPDYTPRPSSQVMHDDEALARMLQDELFSQELSRNPDFAHLARGRPQTVGGMPNRAANPNQGRSNSGTGGPMGGLRLGELSARFGLGGGGQQQQQQQQRQDNNLLEKISELGDNARRRLQLLAAQFNAANSRNHMSGNAGGPGPGAGGPSSPSSERQGLLADEDEDAMELAARKDL